VACVGRWRERRACSTCEPRSKATTGRPTRRTASHRKPGELTGTAIWWLTINHSDSPAEWRVTGYTRSQTMSAAAVAKAGYAGYRKNKDVVIPGWKNRLMVAGVGFLPRFVTRKIVGKMQGI